MVLPWGSLVVALNPLPPNRRHYGTYRRPAAIPASVLHMTDVVIVAVTHTIRRDMRSQHVAWTPSLCIPHRPNRNEATSSRGGPKVITRPSLGGRIHLPPSDDLWGGSPPLPLGEGSR